MRQYSRVIPLPPLRQNHNILSAELLITAAEIEEKSYTVLFSFSIHDFTWEKFVTDAIGQRISHL